MGLIGADMILQAIQAYRLVWISGRFGGGKTSIAYMFAKQFLERGYRLITNNHCIWADDMKETQLLQDTNHLHAVIILDEGGQYFKASKQIEMIASYAAKMDCIYLIPSFFPPVRTAQVVTIQPLWNIRGTGVPLTIYRWSVKIGNFSDKGHFAWLFPEEVYGVYSRQDPGTRGDEVVSFLIQRSEEFREAYGRAQGEAGGEHPIFTLETTPEDLLADAAANFAEAADTMASVPAGKRRRRRI